MQAQEGAYKFYKDDRERIKGRQMLPTETLRYIEALEEIAKAGYEVWKNTPHANKPSMLMISKLAPGIRMNHRPHTYRLLSPFVLIARGGSPSPRKEFV